ncbi:MAG: hypothetical protein U0822_27715 [Anaerolineae bacterium]
MTTKTDYTAEEWQLLVTLPAWAGFAVMISEPKRRRDKNEIAALSEAARKIGPQYADNTLVQAALPEINDANNSSVIEENRKIKDIDTVTQLAVDRCAQTDALLKGKSTGAEAAGYKQFVLQTAHDVAEATADSEFFGIGGETVSRAERHVLRRLADALEIPWE